MADDVPGEPLKPGVDARVLLDEQSVAEQAPLLKQVIDNIPREIHQFMDRSLNSWSRHSSMVLPGAESLVEPVGVSFMWLRRKARGAPPLPAAANFLMPVLGALTPDTEYRIGLPWCRPELKEIVIDRTLGELPGVPFIPALGTDTQPVATGRNAYGPGVLARPGTPHHLVPFRKRDGYLDDVLPLPVIASRWSIQQNHANGRAARAAGEVDVHPLPTGSTHQAVDLPVVGAVKVPVKEAVLAPHEVELPVIGLDDLVQQYPFHRLSVAKFRAADQRRPGSGSRTALQLPARWSGSAASWVRHTPDNRMQGFPLQGRAHGGKIMNR